MHRPEHTSTLRTGDLLEGYREEVVAAWVKLLYSMEESHYREQPVTELQTAAQSVPGRAGRHCSAPARTTV